jgi:hypothetical protein
MADNWFKRLFSNKENNQLELSVLDEIVADNKDDADRAINSLVKEAQSYTINPYDIANSEMLSSIPDYKGKHYYIETFDDNRASYEVLETLSKHPLVSSIVQTRVNQVAEFAQYTSDDDLGFRIVLRDRNKEPTDKDRQNIKDMVSFLQSCGSETLDFELTFESFIRAIIRDSLIYDQCCFEIVRNKKGKVVAFQPVDSSTIRRTKITKDEREAGRRDYENYAYVQVVNNKIVAQFKQEDLCFGVRRPRTSLKSRKYGFPELEELITTLSDIRSAEIYNSANFSNGINANGIIAIKSKMDPKLFRSFRREFYQMLTGVNNAKRTPLIQLDPDTNEDVRSINLSQSNKEMEYNNWINYLIKVLCSVYQMDPAEIGFVFGSEGQSSALIQSDPSARIIMGKEKGLRPLVRSLGSWINKYIIYQIDPTLELEFIGLESVPTKMRVELEEHRMKYMTINEIRASHDLPEIVDGHYIADHMSRMKSAEVIASGRIEAATVRSEADKEKEVIRGEEKIKQDEQKIVAAKELENSKSKTKLEIAGVVKATYSEEEMALIFEQHKEAFMKMASQSELSKAETYVVPQDAADVAQRVIDVKEDK